MVAMGSTAGYHRVNAQMLRHKSGVRVGHGFTTTGNKREIDDVPGEARTPKSKAIRQKSVAK